MESKPRLKIPLNRISRAGEKDATAFTKMGASRQKETVDAMQEIDSIGDFDAKKSEPWWQSQKHRTICFGVSFLSGSILRDSYLKNSIYPSLNRGARNSVDMVGNGLIRHSTVAFTCSQQTLKITDPRIVSSRKHNEPKSTSIMDIGNAAAPWPYRATRLMSPFLSMISCRQTLGFALPLLQNATI